MRKKIIPRRAKRYPVRLPVMELNGRPVSDTLLVDVSSLGARLESTTPLAPRNVAEFVVTLPGHNGPMKLSGTVVWMRPLLHAPGRFHLGLQFFAPCWEIDRLAQKGLLTAD
ncbi:MAG: PilZ domain-containing protein [Desulfobaccales bacterium]